MTRSLSYLTDTLFSVDRIYFRDSLAADDVTIAWMRWRKTSHTFRYGLYRDRERRIEINPILAQSWIPDFVVVSTVLHEALHHVHGMKHSPEFRQAELMFPHLVADEMWRSENLNALIAARPERVKP